MKKNSITSWVNEKGKFCTNIFPILKLNVEARVTRFVSSYRSFDASQLPLFPPLEETTRKWMELRYVARVKGIPDDNTFFVNFFCVCMEKTLISFFFFLFPLLFLPLRDFVRKDIFISDSCVFRFLLFLNVIIQRIIKQSRFCFNIDILLWQKTSLFSW